MKKLALSRGADEAPTSFTGGTESGRGVGSMRTDWLKLFELAVRMEVGFVGGGGRYRG